MEHLKAVICERMSLKACHCVELARFILICTGHYLGYLRREVSKITTTTHMLLNQSTVYLITYYHRMSSLTLYQITKL